MGSVQIKYTELFSLSIQQPFYTNGLTGKYIVEPTLDYQIFPTSESRGLMQRLDMIFRTLPNKGGCTVWGRTQGMSGANPLLYFKPKKGDVLAFVLTLSNPSFLNYNDLPTQLGNDTIYYFSNLVNDATAARDNLHLSTDAAGVAVGDTLKKVQGSYTYTYGAHIAPGNAKLKHATSGLELLPSSLVNDSGQALLNFDLATFPSGKCELQIGGVTVEEAYHLKGTGEATVFAVVECALETLALPNYTIVEADGSITPQRPQYTLLFNNRATLWRYKLVLQENSPLYVEMNGLTPAEKVDFLSRINVVSNDTGVVFIPNVISDTQFEFVSDAPKPLQESYVSSSSATGNALSLALKKYIGHPTIPAEDIKVNLPYPPKHQLDASNDPLIYSDVLLNL